MDSFPVWKRKQVATLLLLALVNFIILFSIYKEETVIRFLYDLETNLVYGKVGPSSLWERPTSKSQRERKKPKIAILSRHGSQLQTEYVELMSCYRDSKVFFPMTLVSSR